ncbi:MAG TPA: response regulator [Pyrinomonadaceae bacterium]|jgi:DNA-binding response OmpR family regulator
MTNDPAVNILYVEDDRDACEMITEFFRAIQPNFTVKSVLNEGDALTAIATETFDVYVIDNWLDGTTGNVLCKKIRANDQTTPIVIYSAVAYEEDIAEGLAAGADAYLTKPNDLHNLVPTLRSLIATRTSVN